LERSYLFPRALLHPPSLCSVTGSREFRCLIVCANFSAFLLVSWVFSLAEHFVIFQLGRKDVTAFFCFSLRLVGVFLVYHWKLPLWAEMMFFRQPLLSTPLQDFPSSPFLGPGRFGAYRAPPPFLEVSATVFFFLP